MLTEFKRKYFSKKNSKKEDHPYATWASIIIILGLTAALVQFNKKTTDPTKTSIEAPINADTYIPKGFTLIPIEVSNYESLDSIIGQYGVVDLFSTPLNPQEKSKRIAYSVKILRAPRNPSHFAVLMPESKADKIAGHIGPFTVTVRNPKETGIKFVQEKRRNKQRRVIYDHE